MKLQSCTLRAMSVLALLAGALLMPVPATAQNPSPAAGSGPIGPETIITVNTTTDELNADGDCSLREAIQAANSDTAVDACLPGLGVDTIMVPAGTYVLALGGAGEDANATGDLDITSNVTIAGAGAATTIVDGNATDRVFHVLASASVQMSSVTVQNGRSSQGGGLLNGGSLSLNAVMVSGNIAQGAAGADGMWLTGGGSGGFGGGVYNTSVLVIDLSTLSGNQAIGGNGGGNLGTGAAGGGGGGAGIGGAIFNDGGTITLLNSTLAGNTARGGNGGEGSGGGGAGGGLGGAIFDNTGSGGVSILNCTLSGNQASGGNGSNATGGGGSGTGAAGGFGQGGQGAHIGGNGGFGGGGGGGGGMGGYGGAGGFAGGNGDTSAGGSGGSGYGGGVFNLKAAGNLGISHSTLTANAANRGAAGFFSSAGTSYGGGLYDNAAIAGLKGSIIAGNTVTDNHPDVSGTVASSGYNVVGNSSGGGGFQTSDLLDTDPLLGALASNGGPTQTHALGAGSPAIDAGTCTDIPGNPVTTDQRGWLRPLGATCDVGAYEVQRCFATFDDGTTVLPILQQAIEASNPGATIKVAGTCAELENRSGNVQVAYLDRDLTVRGGYTPSNWTVSDPVANPTTIDARGGGRAAYIAAGVNITLENLTMTGGDASGDYGGGVYQAGSSLILSNDIITGSTADGGGGLYVTAGSVTINGGQISNNTAPTYGGGGVWIGMASATLTMNSGEIRDNSPLGVYVAQGHMTLAGGQISGNVDNGVFVHNSDASFTQTGGTISANAGGGVSVRYGTATLNGGEIADNLGSGLYVTYGSATIDGIQILRNTGAGDGAGVYVDTGTVTLISGQIADNVATGRGGGLYVAAGGSALGSGVQITGNQAAGGGGLYQANGGTLGLTASCIVDNSDTAVINDGGATLDATGNWWGAADGPSGAGTGSGDSVSVGVDYAGFAGTPFAGCSAVTPPDLVVVKTAEPATAMPGDTVTYTLSWSNNGDGPGRNVTITDVVPVTLTAVTWSAGGAPITATAGVSYAWTAGSVPPGTGGIITLTGVVSPALAGLPATLDNEASITTTGVDASPGNNSSSAAVALNDVAIAGLAAENDSPTILGQATLFTATVSAGTNVVYAWAFGDGQYGSGAALSHVYAAAGLYTAVVTATNGAGSASTTTMAYISNEAPVADAGPDQAVTVDALVTLDGSASTDPDGHLPLAYGWTQTAGLPVALSDPAAAQPTFNAPAAPTGLAFSLVVTDAYGLATLAPDLVAVTVGDVAIAGLAAENDSPTTLGQATLFTATVESGSNVVFAWAFGDGQYGSGAAFSHIYAAAGLYTAIVTTTNGAGSASTTTMAYITNEAPVANAGLDQAVTVEAPVTLDGSASTDPDGHLPLAYGWTQTAGLPVALSDPAAAQPTFNAPAAPTGLQFSLVVTDAYGLATLAPDLVAVTVGDVAIAGLAAENDSPTILGQATLFTATVSAGTNVVYAWAFGDGQYGSGAALSHVYAAAGLYTAVVTATNGAGSASTTTMAYISNEAPVANAGPDQAVTVEVLVTLDGIASSDPDGHLPLAYGWTQTAGPPVVLSDPAAAQPTFSAPAAPTGLQFSLVVTDAYGLATLAADSVAVTVGDVPIDGLVLDTNSPTPFGQPTFFTATVASGSNVEFTWDWGDGSKALAREEAGPLAQSVVSHTYSVAGSYTAVVTATNGAGSASLSTPVDIVAPPTCLAPLSEAGLTGLPQAFVGLTWFFSATLEPAGATPPITYTWSPEPAGGQGTATAAYSWAATGTVTLTVHAQNCGGQATASFAVQVLESISATLEPGVTTTIVYTDPQEVTTTIIIPPGAISESITLVFAPNPTPTHLISDGLVFANHSFDLDAYLGHQLLPGYVFAEPISVSVRYTDDDIAGIQEPGLRLYYWTGSSWADGAGTCSPSSAYSRDLAGNRLAVAICHLTEWNIQGPESFVIRTVYLPLVVRRSVVAPDLVVESLTTASDGVQVVVRNQGSAPVTGEFWVDVYVDPVRPPTRVNETWEQLGEQGLVWGVTAAALPLAPGEAITLTVGDAYFRAEHSHVDWPLLPGTPLYAQVDSAGDRPHGGVLEDHEIRGEPYNNIAGPVYSIPGLGLALPAAEPRAFGLRLPPRVGTDSPRLEERVKSE